MIRSQFLTLAASAPATVAIDLPNYTQTVTFGVVAPFTGPDRRLGEQLADGVRAACDETNLTRGPLDRAYTLRTFDDQNRVSDAMVNAGFATGDTNVVGAIGHISARALLAALPTYAAAQLAIVVPVTTDDRVTANQYRNVFRLPTKDSSEGILFARYLAATVKPTAVHVFVQDGDYGADVTNGLLGQLAASKIVASYTQFPFEKANFAQAAEHGLATKPDYIILAGTVGDMGGLLPVLRAKGYTGAIGATQGFFDGGTIALGAAANDLLISSSMPYLPLAPSTQRARTDFESRYGAMGPLSAFGYASAQLLISAVRRAGSPLRSAILRSLALPTPVETVVGDYSFVPSGDAVDPQIYFYTIANGKFAYVRQAHPSAFSIK